MYLNQMKKKHNNLRKKLQNIHYFMPSIKNSF